MVASTQTVKHFGVALYGLIVALLLGFFASYALATEASYYDYTTSPISITLSSAATDQTYLAVRFPLHTTGLVDSAYVNADGQDMLLRDGSTERAFTAQFYGATSTQWVLLPDIDASQSLTLTLYHGQNTTSADNPRPIFFTANASETVDVPDDASLDIISALTLRADNVRVHNVDFPNTQGAYFTGGTVTEAQGYRIHTFTSSDTLTIVNSGSFEVNYLCVGGGGAGGGVSASGLGGGGGGGGAGEVAQGTAALSATSTITVGSGGTGDTGTGDSGTSSSIGVAVTCAGGAGGGSQDSVSGVAGGAASGGGGGCAQGGATGTGGSGTQSNGGDADGSADCTAGGGGGSSANGANAGTNNGGNGGAGETVTLPDTTSHSVGGGGGGGVRDNGTDTNGTATNGGGAGGAPGNNATANTGGGGGGGGNAGGTPRAGGNGGSGLVVVWYRTGQCLVCKEDSYNLYISGATVTADVTLSGSLQSATTAATLAVDTEYDIRSTYDGSTLSLLINDATEANNAAAGTIDAGSSAILIGGGVVPIEIDRVRIGSYSIDTPTYVLDLQFEPNQMRQTQEGTVGNSWVWTGNIIDQSTNTNDATYQFVRDQSNLTVTVGPTKSRTTYTASTGSETFPTFVSGDATAPLDDAFNVSGATYRWPLSIFNDLVGDASLNQMPDLMFSSLIGFLVSFFAVVGTFGVSRIIGMAILVGLVCFALIVLLTPLPAVLIVVSAAAAVLSLRIIPEPFTAR